MEKVSIQNFAGIKSMDVEFKSINILIGPQGSGKSVTVKLHYFFRSFFHELERNIIIGKSKRELDRRHREKFITFFPKETWPNGNFKVSYSVNGFNISLEHLNNQIKFDYSENLKKAISRIRKVYADEIEKLAEEGARPLLRGFSLLMQIRELIRAELGDFSIHTQFFIPAGRSFYANIQKSIFSLLSDNTTLDPFLIEFGVEYENLKRSYDDSSLDKAAQKEFDNIILEVLKGDYVSEKDIDYLLHKDKRKVELSKASSGQQEILPLIVVLKALHNEQLSVGGITIYIEEPEAHLFPNAQKAIVQLLARVFNNNSSKFQIIVTTHSPYILSSFNNLLEAGRLTELKPEKNKAIAKIVPKAEQLKPGLLTAYSVNNGKKENLIDQETNLITQTVLDSISNDIAIEFGKLLDIEF
ncbi:Predicted ATPase [Chitinophaga sp. YR627]|uniref:AAA family ATPase n=1 Tax=Chitinophaga sp. YR627 TaxID=1881041 RepID=UPI0008DEFD31|nr:ATP-binding protein [Chitinophaga sp. YR627]SFO28380.1 Predicted ATPase [Chitinophaga sp. YR627]